MMHRQHKGNSIRTITHSSFCVLNYMLPECRPNTAMLSVPHKRLSRPDIMGLKQWRTEGGFGVFNPPPRNSEGPPKSCQTQPDCENC